jgi:hypothetical protein
VACWRGGVVHGQNEARCHTEVRMSMETVLWGLIFAIMAVGGVGLAACLWVFARAPRR